MINQNKDSPQFPPASPEIIAEIVAVDCLLADLFLKCQGNAREIDELTGVLENHLESCENVRDHLLGFQVEQSNPPGLTMIDLPIFEQRMIASTGLFSKMLLEAIQVLTKSDAATLKQKLIDQVNVQVWNFSDAEITQFLQNHLKRHEELAREHNALVSSSENNN